MSYEFSIGSLIAGIVILVIGIVCVRFYQWIADNFGSGASSYERYRLYAMLVCALGFIVMLNLHSMLLLWFFGLVFGR